MKNGWTPGTDDISAKTLKLCGDTIAVVAAIG